MAIIKCKMCGGDLILEAIMLKQARLSQTVLQPQTVN